MAGKNSSIPLDNLIAIDNNRYELTNAVIHRAKQISVTGADELGKGPGKVVSLAIKEIITGEVEYLYKE